MPVPKIIHYAWFSDETQNEVHQNCFNSWHHYLSGYEFMLWDKSKAVPSVFFNKMIKKEKWAFAADYVRLYALYQYGGIYLDLDTEVLKSLDDILHNNCILGREDENTIGGHFLAAGKNHPFIKECLDFYDRSIRLKISPPPTIPRILTRIARTYGLQNENSEQILMNGVFVYPSEYFSPLHYKERLNENPKKHITDKSYCIHYWQHGWSWLNKKNLLTHIFNQPWLFMNLKDWKRFFISLLLLIKQKLN